MVPRIPFSTSIVGFFFVAEVVDVLCEEEGDVQIRMRWPKDGDSRMFNRPRDQLLEKTLMRMSLTLQKGPLDVT